MESSHLPTHEQFLGCLLGAAIGDALGMPVEGWPAEAIRDQHGWVDHYLPRASRTGDVEIPAGEITDDTEMMLCHVESLVSSGGMVDPDNTGMRFLRLFNSDSRRFMDRTTRLALEQAEHTGDFQNGVGGDEAAGNGVAMRIAPIGLVHSVGQFNAEVFAREVLRAGLITHSNPVALNGGLAMAYAVRLLASREVTPEVLADEVASFIDEDDVARRVRMAGLLCESGLNRDGHLARLARVGVSESVVESVAAAFYCFMASPHDYRGAVELAVNAGGDADTVAAMTGALAGAYFGAGALPEDLVEGLVARAYILMASPSLYEVALRRGGRFIRLQSRF